MEKVKKVIKEKGAVLPVDNVEIEYTDKSKHYSKGDKSMVHVEIAKKLVEKGAATLVKDGKTEKTKAPDAGDAKV